MDHRDHVNLLKKGIPETGGIWTDFGSGRGSFTIALAELLGPAATIYSVDRDSGALRQQEKRVRTQFPQSSLHYLLADFTEPLNIPPLDGLVVANVLHFLRKKEKTIALLREYLRPGGRFLVVEYNSDQGNHWVPYPFSYESWLKLAGQIGFEHTELLETVPSSFMGEIYAAASW